MKIKVCNAFNAMFVDTVTLVFVTLTQHLIQSTMRCDNCINSVDIDSIECIRDPCLVSTVSTYMKLIIQKVVNFWFAQVWLKRPIEVSAFQNFLQIENPLNIKKVMGRNVWMCVVSTVST